MDGHGETSIPPYNFYAVGIIIFIAYKTLLGIAIHVVTNIN
jgi:hypothetical protein